MANEKKPLKTKDVYEIEISDVKDLEQKLDEIETKVNDAGNNVNFATESYVDSKTSELKTEVDQTINSNLLIAKDYAKQLVDALRNEGIKEFTLENWQQYVPAMDNGFAVIQKTNNIIGVAPYNGLVYDNGEDPVFEGVLYTKKEYDNLIHLKAISKTGNEYNATLTPDNNFSGWKMEYNQIKYVSNSFLSEEIAIDESKWVNLKGEGLRKGTAITRDDLLLDQTIDLYYKDSKKNLFKYGSMSVKDGGSKTSFNVNIYLENIIKITNTPKLVLQNRFVYKDTADVLYVTTDNIEISLINFQELINSKKLVKINSEQKEFPVLLAANKGEFKIASVKLVRKIPGKVLKLYENLTYESLTIQIINTDEGSYQKVINPDSIYNEDYSGEKNFKKSSEDVATFEVKTVYNTGDTEVIGSTEHTTEKDPLIQQSFLAKKLREYALAKKETEGRYVYAHDGANQTEIKIVDNLIEDGLVKTNVIKQEIEKVDNKYNKLSAIENEDVQNIKNINNKLSKKDEITEKQQLYAKDANGTQNMLDVDSEAAANTIVKRKADGIVEVGDAVSNKDAINKKILEQKLNEQSDNIDEKINQTKTEINQTTDNKINQFNENTVKKEIKKVTDKTQEINESLEEYKLTNNTKVENIEKIIPTTASESNKLADVQFVLNKIRENASRYITYNAEGDSFPTKASLISATTLYYDSQIIQQSSLINDDTAIVLKDESNDNKVCKYIYKNNQWKFQYHLGTSFSVAQQQALDSGISSSKVTKYEGYQEEIDKKQNKLVGTGEGQNIKTVNGQNILGEGDINIPTFTLKKNIQGSGNGVKSVDVTEDTIDVVKGDFVEKGQETPVNITEKGSGNAITEIEKGANSHDIIIKKEKSFVENNKNIKIKGDIQGLGNIGTLLDDSLEGGFNVTLKNVDTQVENNSNVNANYGQTVTIVKNIETDGKGRVSKIVKENVKLPEAQSIPEVNNANINIKLNNKQVDNFTANQKNNKDININITKGDVGLGNVDNTSDVNKPISSATQEALDNKITKNPDIVGKTATKVTYDKKGLITDSEPLTESDIPDIDYSKIKNKPTSIKQTTITDVFNKEETISKIEERHKSIIFNNGFTEPDIDLNTDVRYMPFPKNDLNTLSNYFTYKITIYPGTIYNNEHRKFFQKETYLPSSTNIPQNSSYNQYFTLCESSYLKENEKNKMKKEDITFNINKRLFQKLERTAYSIGRDGVFHNIVLEDTLYILGKDILGTYEDSLWDYNLRIYKRQGFVLIREGIPTFIWAAFERVVNFSEIARDVPIIKGEHAQPENDGKFITGIYYRSFRDKLGHFEIKREKPDFTEKDFNAFKNQENEKNKIYASPTNKSGKASFRYITETDLPNISGDKIQDGSISDTKIRGIRYNQINGIEQKMNEKAPIDNPSFTGRVQKNGKDLSTEEYVINKIQEKMFKLVGDGAEQNIKKINNQILVGKGNIEITYENINAPTKVEQAIKNKLENSPVLKGIPKAPTADVETDQPSQNEMIANTAYVRGKINKELSKKGLNLNEVNLNKPKVIMATGTEILNEHGVNVKYVKDYVDEKISTKIQELVGSSPEALNTLNELAQALGNDANFATTINNKISSVENTINEKADKNHKIEQHNNVIQNGDSYYQIRPTEADGPQYKNLIFDPKINKWLFATKDPNILTTDHVGLSDEPAEENPSVLLSHKGKHSTVIYHKRVPKYTNEEEPWKHKETALNIESKTSPSNENIVYVNRRYQYLTVPEIVVDKNGHVINHKNIDVDLSYLAESQRVPSFLNFEDGENFKTDVVGNINLSGGSSQSGQNAGLLLKEINPPTITMSTDKLFTPSSPLLLIHPVVDKKGRVERLLNHSVNIPHFLSPIIEYEGTGSVIKNIQLSTRNEDGFDKDILKVVRGNVSDTSFSDFSNKWNNSGGSFNGISDVSLSRDSQTPSRLVLNITKKNFLTENQQINLNGDIQGSGKTSITTSLKDIHQSEKTEGDVVIFSGDNLSSGDLPANFPYGYHVNENLKFGVKIPKISIDKKGRVKNLSYVSACFKGPSVVSAAKKLETGRSIQIGSTSKIFDGTSSLKFELNEIGAASASDYYNFKSNVNNNFVKISDLPNKVKSVITSSVPIKVNRFRAGEKSVTKGNSANVFKNSLDAAQKSRMIGITLYVRPSNGGPHTPTAIQLPFDNTLREYSFILSKGDGTYSSYITLRAKPYNDNTWTDWNIYFIKAKEVFNEAEAAVGTLFVDIEFTYLSW